MQNSTIPTESKQSIRTILDNLLKLEYISGLLIISAAIIALVVNNANYDFYFKLVHSPITNHYPNLTFHSVTNNGLMILFFTMVGLEIKEELLFGSLAKKEQRLLPFVATIFGVFVPGLIYLIINYDISSNLHGWAIPVVTDIAFALCILSFFNVPRYLKIFLLSLAIFDDLIGIVIIAIFYTEQLHLQYLLYAIVTIATLLLTGKKQIAHLYIYIMLGIILCYFISMSGIHPTIAGVIFAFCLPVPFLRPMITKLHPYSGFIITPLFSFVNSGINFSKLTIEDLLSPMSLGIIFGLFIGKQLGVFLSAYILCKTKLVKLPPEITTLQLYGVSLLTGIGFTVSMFINDLAFVSEETIRAAKISIMIGSVLSGLCGYICLRICTQTK